MLYEVMFDETCKWLGSDEFLITIRSIVDIGHQVGILYDGDSFSGTIANIKGDQFILTDVELTAYRYRGELIDEMPDVTGHWLSLKYITELKAESQCFAMVSTEK